MRVCTTLSLARQFGQATPIAPRKSPDRLRNPNPGRTFDSSRRAKSQRARIGTMMIAQAVGQPTQPDRACPLRVGEQLEIAELYLYLKGTPCRALRPNLVRSDSLCDGARLRGF